VKTKKEEWTKINCHNLKSAIVIFLFLVLMFLLIVLIHPYYCKYWGDRYTQNSQCYDENYRCEIECSHYNLNYNGKIQRCYCDCGEKYVSICTGQIYDKTNPNING
jgi:hypothetical protein